MFFSRRRKRGGGWRHCHAGGGGERHLLSLTSALLPGDRGKGKGRIEKMAFLVGGRSTGRTLDLFFQEKNNDMLLPTVPNICGTIGVFDFNKSREIFILPARNYVREN